MNIAFYNGVSGMIAYQQDMDTLGHNMANVNTAGYKEQRSAFGDLLYTQMDTNEEHLIGHGVKVAKTQLMYEQGALSNTNNMLDFALMGDGFFAVERNGETEYTRNGTFDISLEGKNGYLVTSDDGSYVLDSKGKPIKLTKEKDAATFNVDDLVDKIGVYTFKNPYGLEQTNGSSFRETELSGEPETIKGNAKKKNRPYDVIQGALECSSVDVADAMVNVMVSQKAFQFSAKMVRTADEVEEIVNNLR